MKVTSVEIIEAKHYLFVKVHTDAGITGLGEAGNWGFYRRQKGLSRNSLNLSLDRIHLRSNITIKICTGPCISAEA